MKNPECTFCGGLHYQTFCPKKPRKPLPRSTKPIRKEAVKTRQKRKATEIEWFEANPPDQYGRWKCYIPKHPNCPKYVTIETINLEHSHSKARYPEFKYDITKLFPACSWDNEAKGSLSAEEYMNSTL